MSPRSTPPLIALTRQTRYRPHRIAGADSRRRVLMEGAMDGGAQAVATSRYRTVTRYTDKDGIGAGQSQSDMSDQAAGFSN